MDDFLKLWKEFVIGTNSLNYHLRKGATPFYQKERERFMKKIVEPMDAAWMRLEPADRAQFAERPKWN